jgi:hypothetical protein
LQTAPKLFTLRSFDIPPFAKGLNAMRTKYLSSAVAVALLAPAAFANTNAGVKLYICATAQQADLDAAAYAGLTWVQVKGVGSHGETGSQTNIVNYDTWDTEVTQKGKGITNAGDPEVELARIPTDPGQVLMRAAAATNLNYAFKMERNDVPDADPESTPTILYNRGLVTGPRRPHGRNEDFDLEVYTIACNQKEVVVNPTSGL